MDIKIPLGWLKDWVDTDATAPIIAQKLSLCGPSVERVTKNGRDWIMDIEVTSNRPDSASVYGIAQEAAAILPRFGYKATLQKLPKLHDLSPETNQSLPLKLNIAKDTFGPRFSAIVLDNVKIGPSTKLIQERLKQVGIRPINNVVDITNYLMVEIGQPMHAFDYDKITSHSLNLRESKKGEKITTLDGVEHILPAGIIVGEDNGRLIDLCGVMGGFYSEVDNKTQKILLFVQTYNPKLIRRATQVTALRTDAASLYEKGLDPEKVELGIKMATSMIKKYAGAKIASELVDIYKARPQKRTVKLSYDYLNKILGFEISKVEIRKILTSLGFEVGLGIVELEAVVPSWRLDVQVPEDLIEEIARIYGYFEINGELPSGNLPKTPPSPMFYWGSQVKKTLADWGFNEVYNYSLVSEDLLSRIGEVKNVVKLLNPLTEDMTVMRTTLIPQLLENIKLNKTGPDLRFFELSNIYLSTENDLPQELPMLTFVQSSPSDDFFSLKGVLENLTRVLKVGDVEFRKINHPYLSPAAEILIEDKKVGVLGEVKKITLNKFGISRKVIIADLDFTNLVQNAKRTNVFSPIPRYQPITFDLTLATSGKLIIGDILKTSRSSSRILKEVEVRDIFIDEKKSNETSTTLRLSFWSTKPLTSEDAKAELGKVTKALEIAGAKIKAGS